MGKGADGVNTTNTLPDICEEEIQILLTYLGVLPHIKPFESVNLFLHSA